MKNYILKWNEQILLVEGYNRTCLYDLPRGQYKLVDKEIRSLIDRIEGRNLSEIKLTLTDMELDWIDFLLADEYLLQIPANLIDCFPKINLTFESPSIITSAIILDSDSVLSTLKFLKTLNCRHVLIRVKDEKELDSILNNHLQKTNFQCVDFQIMKLNIDIEELKLMLDGWSVVGDVTIVNHSEFEKVSLNNHFTFIKNHSERIRGNSFKPSFYMSIESYTESLQKNLYYNQKLFFFKNEIYLTEDCNESIGNIEKIDQNSFERNLKNSANGFWSITKEKITVCKVCEFRRMCADRRIPKRVNNENLFYLEHECTYNPFISLWADEAGYLNLDECRINPELGEQGIDHENLEKINEKIWL